MVCRVLLALSNTNTMQFKTLLITAAVIFLWPAVPVLAQSVAYPVDVIESPAVNKADVVTHFKNIFGRDPSAGEVKYWQIRLKDKPNELEFLAAMGYWAAQGESPSIDDSKFTVTLSGTGKDIFAGQTRRHTITVTHTNPVAQQGYLDIKIDAKIIDPTPPLPNTQQTYVNGVHRLRHKYYLEPNETLTVDVIVTAPNKPTYTFDAILRGRGKVEGHVTKVYSVIPETLKNPTFAQRQIPVMFARVFGRTPTKTELAAWRTRLTKTHRLETIQGAMEVARGEGSTLPAGYVLGSSSPMAVENLNTVFRSVYGHDPSVSEWHYWAGRITAKATVASFTDTLKYHFQNSITH